MKNLWIGNEKDAQEEALSDYGITKVVTVCQDSTEDNVGCSYSRYNMSDGPDNKYGGRHDYEIFHSAVGEVVESINQGDTVLVHCHRGRSRSAAVVIASVGRLKSVGYDKSREVVESARPVINPDKLLVKHAEENLSKMLEDNEV